MSFGFPRGFDIEGVASSAFPKAEFNAVKFPYSDLSVKGAIRYAQHEFPHTPGAEVEKMGRKPYVITFTCPFHYLQGSELDKQYPGLYPNGLRDLRTFFEQEITANLVVPTIGTITAVATSWTQTYNVHVVSGEQVTLEFLEDQDATNNFANQTLDFGFNEIQQKNEALLAEIALADAMSAQSQSIFQDINDAITKVQGVLGVADAYNRVAEGKIRAVAQLCAYADGQIQELQDPTNHLIVDALKDLWLSTQQLAANVIESRDQLLLYRVPRTMGINQIATTLYGSTEKTMTLLQLNSFEDALAIPAGTSVVYPRSGLAINTRGA